MRGLFELSATLLCLSTQLLYAQVRDKRISESPKEFKFIGEELWSLDSMKDNRLVHYQKGSINESHSITLQLEGKKTQFRLKAFDRCFDQFIVSGHDLSGEFLAEVVDLKKGQLKKISNLDKAIFPIRDILNLSPLGLPGCLLLGSTAYHFKDKLNKITPFPLPSLIDIPEIPLRLDQTNIAIDPFKNWQEFYQVSETVAYHSVIAGDLLLLSYPRRAKIIVGSKLYEGRPFWNKWGHWGVREGEFQLPSTLAYLDQLKLLAVSDPISGVIFFFTVDGEYRGQLEKGFKELFSITALHDKLVVYDSESKTPYLFTVTASSLQSFTRNYLNPPPFQEYKKCKSCHESTEYFSVLGDSPFASHHPIGLLRNGQLNIACTSCHDGHHSTGIDKNLKLKPKALCFLCHATSTKPLSHPFEHNKKMDRYCLSCHALHSSEKINRCLDCHEKFTKVVGKRPHLTTETMDGLSAKVSNYPGGTCLSCHNPHLKKVDSVALCTSCHSDKKITHREFGKEMVADFKKVRTDEGKLLCITCHDQHGIIESRHQLKERAVIRPLCGSCHDDDADKMIDEYHLTKKKL